jgi:hypothetical protein
MANDSTEVRVYGDGGVYVADVGTEFPASISEAIDLDDWTNLGFLTEEGPRFSFGRETTDLLAWQSMDPIRVLTTAAPKTIAFDLMQSNRHTLEMALGGGTITEPSPGEFEFEPADPSDIYERALIVEMVDGAFTYRFCYRKVTQDGAVEFAGVRTDSTNFAVTMKVLAADAGEKPYLVQSDDEALAATGS